MYNDYDEASGPSARTRLVPRKAKRAETLPTFLEPLPAPIPQPLSLDDLPPNPKLWTPSQLSSYLISALRIRPSDGGAILPDRVAKDIAAFVKHARMTGRTFLRLTEEDLNSLNVNRKWGEALLIASRNLRQNVLKGRIWGTDSDELPSPGSTSPTLSSQLYYSANNSSSSSVELPPNEGESEKPPRRYRNGRVRGMVENLERSFSSDSSCDESDDHRLTRLVRQAGSIEQQPPHTPPMDESSPPARPVVISDTALEEEPTVEDLLAASEVGHRSGTWGARAWEELDFVPGVTVKHIGNGSNGQDATSLAQSSSESGLLTVVKNRSVKGSWKNSIRRGRDERRVVTAIFTPTIAEPHAGSPSDDQHLSGDQLQIMDVANPSAPGVELDPSTQVPEVVEQAPNPLEETLLTELSENRALVEAFRLRLELVEKKVADLEEREAQRERDVRLDAVTRAEFAVQTTPPEAQIPQETTPVLPPFVSQASLALHSITEHLIPTGGATVRGDDEDGDGKAKDDDGPTTMSELPSYVFLVGLGVCAVVLQVMLRKVGGRNFGWRP